MMLGDFNVRTYKLEDFVSNYGNNFTNDICENCLQAKHRQNFDNHINNHGEHLINICKILT